MAAAAAVEEEKEEEEENDRNMAEYQFLMEDNCSIWCVPSDWRFFKDSGTTFIYKIG